MRVVIWFTGLSGAGKSTVCEAWKVSLESRGYRVGILDGDLVRAAHPRKLGFSRQDVREGNLSVAEMAMKSISEHQIILVPVIAPYQEVRDEVKGLLGPVLKFVYCNAGLEIVKQRDVKGLYAKAERGEIEAMIGTVGEFPYEVPVRPDLILDTTQSLDECIKELDFFLYHSIQGKLL